MKDNKVFEAGGFDLTGAARFIGINRTAVCALVQRPDFPAFRVGRRWVIPREALSAWMNSNAGKRALIELGR